MYDRGWQEEYEKMLDTAINKKQEKIRNICCDNYEVGQNYQWMRLLIHTSSPLQEFIGAVDTLLALKLEVAELKVHLVELNRNVQESGKQVTKKVNPGL